MIAVRIIADSRNIVRQSIEPDINNILLIKINRNSPGEGRAGNTEIL